MFELDPRLREDSVPLGTLPLCLVRLHRDARYPWVLLIPERAGVREIHELDMSDRRALIEESAAISAAMQRALGASKMNVAALGNVVPQLHVHHIARFTGDDAWPGPVWGAHPPLAYADDALPERLRKHAQDGDVRARSASRGAQPPRMIERASLLTEAFAKIPGFVPALRSAGVSSP